MPSIVKFAPIPIEFPSVSVSSLLWLIASFSNAYSMRPQPPRLSLGIFEDNVAKSLRHAAEFICRVTIFARVMQVTHQAGVTAQAAAARPPSGLFFTGIAAFSVMFVHPPPARVTKQHWAKNTPWQAFNYVWLIALALSKNDDFAVDQVIAGVGTARTWFVVVVGERVDNVGTGIFTHAPLNRQFCHCGLFDS